MSGCLKFVLAVVLALVLYKFLGLIGLAIGIFVLIFMAGSGNNNDD